MVGVAFFDVVLEGGTGAGKNVAVAGGVDHHVGHHRHAAFLALEDHALHRTILDDGCAAPGVVDQLDLAAYLDRVTELLDAIVPDPVSVSGHFEPATIAPKDGAIVGTVLNELVANAVKHSLFAQGGTIAIRGERTGEGAYRITVQDDGSHTAPPAASGSKRTGLGLAIIDASVRQLGGSITSAVTAEGYRTVLEFAV